MFWSRFILALVLVALVIALPSSSAQDASLSASVSALSRSNITFENESNFVLSQVYCTFVAHQVFQYPATVIQPRQTTTVFVQSSGGDIAGSCLYNIGQNAGQVEFNWQLAPNGPLVFTAPVSPGFGVVIVFQSPSRYDISLNYGFMSLN
eukprot:TRINITY_DN161_c0_g2_i1.p1 TRINITY_DN161_c0_g2~~TRINITY_DN161_c0_g2_i1.p1  ORF type:complete len:150 (-),score=14.24 TRINITY_DN161_c0_g2_i1:68-517(-)